MVSVFLWIKKNNGVGVILGILIEKSSVYFHHPAESPLSQEGRGWSVNTVRKSPAK